VDHIAQIKENINSYKILVGTPSKRDHMKDLNVDGKIILKQILKKKYGRA
jgi:hypothetical protein